MLIVAGLNLRNLHPRVWDKASPYYLPKLRAVMVSYADFHRMPSCRAAAMNQGLHKYLGVPKRVKIYLDNGAFYFMTHDRRHICDEYEEFVSLAQPDWRPIPQDFIPTPQMTIHEQRLCFRRTMKVNRAYQHDGFVPVIHVSQFLEKYTQAIKSHERLSEKLSIALGAIVPNLLRAPKAISYLEVLRMLKHVREEFENKTIHIFGVGGTATLHLTALLGMDSVDSSGWRNRAARGIIQLPGSGDRMVADLGSWRGRTLSSNELKRLRTCQCPACQQKGVRGLKARELEGFCNRATHNLWVLLEEAEWINRHIRAGTYADHYKEHLNNSIYMPLIEHTLSSLV